VFLVQEKYHRGFTGHHPYFIGHIFSPPPLYLLCGYLKKPGNPSKDRYDFSNFVTSDKIFIISQHADIFADTKKCFLSEDTR